MKAYKCKAHRYAHDYAVCPECGCNYCSGYWSGCPRCKNADIRPKASQFDPANEDEWNYKQTHKARNGY